MTNNQAIAYAIIAMEQLSYTIEQIKKVLASMQSEMDWTDENTAEKSSKYFARLNKEKGKKQDVSIHTSCLFIIKN